MGRGRPFNAGAQGFHRGNGSLAPADGVLACLEVAADAEPQLLRNIFGGRRLRPAEGVEEGRIAKPVRQAGNRPAGLRVYRCLGFDAGGRGQVRQARGGVDRHPKQGLHFLDRQRHSAPRLEQNSDTRGAPGSFPCVPRSQGHDDMPAGIQAAPS